MDVDRLLSLFQMGQGPVFDVHYHIFNGVQLEGMYSIHESNYRINLFREMLVNYAQKGGHDED